MPLLAYCIADAGQLNQSGMALAEIPAGVGDAAIRLLSEARLACLISDWAPGTKSSGSQSGTAAQSAAELEKAALVFHRAVQAVFSRTAVIPFRFPTLFAAESGVIELLRERSAEYGCALARLQGKAQLDVRISMQTPNPAAEGPATGDAPAKQSGAEYLRRKQAHQRLLSAAAESLRQAGQPWIEDWRERPQADGLRCFALAERGAMLELARALEAVRIPAGIIARATGPWPATEFVNAEPEEHASCAARRTL